jgi:hypothetical protein
MMTNSNAPYLRFRAPFPAALFAFATAGMIL